MATTTARPEGTRVLARLRGLVQASHPGPVVVVTGIGTGVAAAAGGGPGTVALVGSAVLTGQLSVGWSNDRVDAARDRAVGRGTKPVVAGLVAERTLVAGAVGALVLCAVLSLATGLVAGLVHLVAVASAWAYNLRLKATAWSWAPYALSFALLPVFAVLAVPGAGPPAPWVPATGALLGVGAHLANVVPDLDDDAATGVRGLPHRLGRTGSGVLAPALLVAGTLVAAAGGGAVAGWRAGVVALAVVTGLGAGVVVLRRPRSRHAFPLTMLVAVLCVVVLASAGARLLA